ncbi:MAG: aldolase/citrate lyase family protein [Chloroflexi bacterium]|nr:aldolase/citrate lyase family protein [Chloroflexota bacterium]
MESALAIRDALVRRSLLVVSPLDRDALERAVGAGADAVVLDVARGPAAHRREEARRGLGAAIASVAQSGAEVLLWTDAGGAGADLAACEGGVSGVLAAAESAADVASVDGALRAWEAARGLGPGSVNIAVVLATGAAVRGCDDIAGGCSRVVALVVDERALVRSAGENAAARRELAAYYRGAVVVAAKALGVQAHGAVAPGSGALAAGYATMGRRMGLRGALCFDADAVSLVNAGFSPTEGEVTAARRVLSAMEDAVAGGRGAIAASPGTMADLANVRQAQAVVDRAEAIRRRHDQPEPDGEPSATEPSTEEGSAPPWR